jgi:(2Fe-2S) ferredoxin
MGKRHKKKRKKRERGMAEEKEDLQKIAGNLCIGGYVRHVFLCVGGKCASEEEGRAAWERLKRELKDRNLSLSTVPNACYRSKVDCLRVCAGGPIMVVYPEGTWYSAMTADRIPLFVEQHLEQGKPVEEWIFARNPLPAEGQGSPGCSAQGADEKAPR